jgi:hypothetical protein
MTHEAMVALAIHWLRSRYRCSIVLSEQSCASGEQPDVIGWKSKCRSVLVECKASRADFLADRQKPFRADPELGMGSERFYMAPAGMIRSEELPAGWGLLEVKNRKVQVAIRCAPRRDLRSGEGLRNELNLLLASLARVQLRIEPQTITDFLKWENRMARYNGGALPRGISSPAIPYLEAPSPQAEMDSAEKDSAETAALDRLPQIQPSA